MQNRTKLFAACALPVMLSLGLLAGCDGQTPSAAQSEISIKQLNKTVSAAVKTPTKNNNVVTSPVINKPGTGAVSFTISGMAPRRVLYARADIVSMLIFLQNNSGGTDVTRTVTAAEITSNTQTFTMNNVNAGNYQAFVTASKGNDPLVAGDVINVGGAPAQSTPFTVTAGNTATPSIALTLADTPATMGAVGAQIVITDGL